MGSGSGETLNHKDIRHVSSLGLSTHIPLCAHSSTERVLKASVNDQTLLKLLEFELLSHLPQTRWLKVFSSGKGRFIWAFTTGLHHFKACFPIVIFNCTWKMHFLLEKSLSHTSLFFARAFQGVPCSFLLCKSSSSLDSSILYHEGTGRVVSLGFQQGPLYLDRDIFRRRQV